MDLLYDCILIFQIAAGIMPLFFSIYLKKTIPLSLNLFLFSSVISSILLIVTSKLYINNIIIYNSYHGISTILLCIFYIGIISIKKFKLFIKVIAFLFTTIFFFEIIKYEDLKFSFMIENLSLIAFSLIYYIDNINNDHQIKLSQTYLIINTSLLMYNCYSLVSNLEINLLMVTDYWIVHNIIESLSKLIIAFAIWKQPKTYNS